MVKNTGKREKSSAGTGAGAEMVSYRKVLVANRGEIAIRVMRAVAELGKRTVAIYTEQDKLSLHCFKADEAYKIGIGRKPIEGYLAIDDILALAESTGVDAIHPGYGFLSESPELAEACAERGITFIGPKPETLRLLGDKWAARRAAEESGVPVIPASEIISGTTDEKALLKLAEPIGYPLVVKAVWGGGGRGMRRVTEPSALAELVAVARSEAGSAFGRDEVYLERSVENARHVEVQILGDKHGNIFHLFERDCSVQRRNQKIVECAPSPSLDEHKRAEVAELALRLVRHTGYEGAGTVEFLQDMESGAFHFIEVNPRIQVEHTVTEQVTGVDLVKAQIRIAEGGRLGVVKETGVPPQEELKINGYAVQCRITSEDPLNNFIPDYGRITAYRGAMGFGIRLDGGTAYSGAVVTRHYDSLLEKVTSWGASHQEAVERMVRALREFRIRGVATNLVFLESVVSHPKFLTGDCSTRFIDQHPELFTFRPRADRATKLLHYIADITVNGHPDIKGRKRKGVRTTPPTLTQIETEVGAPPASWRAVLDAEGAEALAAKVLAHERTLITDTTMRDAHQSLLATRMRSFDMYPAARVYARRLSPLFSVECWGGATFDVAYRFLQEDPWARLKELRRCMPNLLLQMLIRGANGVGYTNYPDNVVRDFTLRAAEAGVDVFRVFDSLNWVENMRVSIDAVLESGKICEGAICYTGSLDDPSHPKYNLDYYMALARELKASGVHFLAIKDMAGLLTPRAVRKLVPSIKEETGLPLHLHMHDTAGGGLATLIAAVESGADIVDCAFDSLSGMTSQPCLGALVEMLRSTPYDTGLDGDEIRALSHYWEAVRGQYGMFEAQMKAPASEVYLHEMPGGQFTNLQEQARALGLQDRWPEVAEAYAQVNRIFGDIPKVTPSSKVVGDMALSMVAAGISAEEVVDPEREISFPDSVIGFFRGDLGQPPGGFPSELQRKVLKGEVPMTGRPGEELMAVDLEEATITLSEELGGIEVTDEMRSSWLMYPRVFLEYMERHQHYGPVEILPTSTFFYGMRVGEEISVNLERGKTMIVRCLGVGEVNDQGMVRVFFELNGQPRTARVPDRRVMGSVKRRPRAEAGNALHVAAPMPGMVSSLAIEAGRKVQTGDLLLTLEAMKMESAVRSTRSGTIATIHVAPGDTVEAKDLLVEYQA